MKLRRDKPLGNTSYLSLYCKYLLLVSCMNMNRMCRENDVAVTVYPILVSSAVPTRAWASVYSHSLVPHSMTDTDRHCTVL